MKREIIWTWSAEADLQEVFANGEALCPGDGEKFLHLVDALLDLLRQFPQMAAIWRTPVRRALIRRSNFGVFYVPEGSRLVIVAVQDLRRDPETLRKTIEGRLPR
jgi:plasmid stabilization system protein ParE